MKKMRHMCSRLRHKMALQREIRTADDVGGYTREWETVAYLWAEIAPLKGREYLFGDKLQASVSHKITVRHRNIDPGMRFVMEGRVFNIRYIRNPEERGHSLEVFVEEGVAG